MASAMAADEDAGVQRTQPGSISEIFKFTMLAAVLAIFADAAIAHAMLWQNDPYWTYWVTDTLLMATVFGLGTALFGVGLFRGAIITAVHVTILTTYYWLLSPIGLPSQPEWLDLEHTWLTGLPVHFGVYYLGYLLALRLWQHRPISNAFANRRITTSVAATATWVLVTVASVVIIIGWLQTLIVGEFPGVTWFIVRIAVAFPFTLGWFGIARTGPYAATTGGIMLGFLLTTYSHYLSPVGLPNPSLRLLADNPPPAAVHWLSYREEFLVLLPLTIVVAVAAYLILARCLRTRPRELEPRWGRAGIASAIAAGIGLAGVGLLVAPYTGPDANTAKITSVGTGSVEYGVPFQGEFRAAPAMLTMSVENRNTHRTPLAPHDRINIEATIQGSDGADFTVLATEPMVSHPKGQFTTWSGVGFDVWHHGRSGIGTSQLPPTKSEVAAYAIGSISTAGGVLATGIPIHVMTSSRDAARLELHVGDPDSPLPGMPNGYLRVTWTDFEGGPPASGVYARYVWGSGVLIVLLGFALAAAGTKQTRTSGIPPKAG